MAANAQGSSAFVFKNKSTPGHLAFGTPKLLALGYNQSFTMLADMNGDNMPDILMSSFSPNNTTGKFSVILHAAKKDSIAFLVPKSFDVSGDPEYFTSGDLDGDGKVDVITTSLRDSISVLQNVSTLNNVAFKKTNLVSHIIPFDVRLGDINGDGKPDALVGSDFNSQAAILINNSTSTAMSFKNEVILSDTATIYTVALSDLDEDGRPEIITGAATGNNPLGNKVIIFKNQFALPLALLSFTGEITHNTAQLQWQTANEQNTAWFNIEHSVDGTAFNTVGKVKAAGYSTVEKSYAFADANLADGANYYRLKMLDADGKFTYSKIIKLDNGSSDVLVTYPNPARDYVIVKHPTTGNNATLQVFDMGGKIIKTINLAQGASQSTISLQHLPAGSYTITWQDGTRKQTKTVIKQ